MVETESKYQLCELAAIAYARQLYATGTFKRKLLRIMRGEHLAGERIALYRSGGGEVIGIAYLSQAGNLHAFVKPNHRRKGIGRLLVRALRTASSAKHFGDHGEDYEGARSFWTSIGIPFGPHVIEHAIELEEAGVASSDALDIAQADAYTKLNLEVQV